MKCRFCKNEIPDGSIFCSWCGERQVKSKKRPDEISVPRPRQISSGQWNIELRREGQSATFATADECTVWAKAVRAGFVKTRIKPESITLRDACTKYIEANRGRLRASSIQGYEKIRDNNFSALMEKRLCDISTAVLKEAVNTECKIVSPRTKKPYAPKTIKNNYLFIVTVLHEHLPDLDAKIPLPEVKQKPVRVLTPEAVYQAVKGSSVELPCLLAMWLSFTMSEIRGLTKSKSLSNGQISVVEAVVDIRGKPVREEGGKEVFRTRTLNLPPYLKELIDKVEGDAIVPMSGQAISKRFYRLLDKAGLQHIPFHRLRHINASVMAALNVPELEANQRGGWKSDYTRKRVYTHSFSEQRRLADEAIDAYFGQIISG